MTDIYEALKIISVFSEYEYRGKKINLTLKWLICVYLIIIVFKLMWKLCRILKLVQKLIK